MPRLQRTSALRPQRDTKPNQATPKQRNLQGSPKKKSQKASERFKIIRMASPQTYPRSPRQWRHRHPSVNLLAQLEARIKILPSTVKEATEADAVAVFGRDPASYLARMFKASAHSVMQVLQQCGVTITSIICAPFIHLRRKRSMLKSGDSSPTKRRMSRKSGTISPRESLFPRSVNQRLRLW